MFKKKRSENNINSVPNRRRSSLANDANTLRPSVQELSDRYAFRRNRTITGSSSSKIMSPNELNAELQSPRAHIHHLTSLRRKLFMSFGIVTAAVFGLYILLSQTVATEVFQVKGTPVLAAAQQQAYINTIEDYYSARPVERLRFLLDNERLVLHMQAEHPEIESLSIEQTTIGEALVSIVPREPLARWNIDANDQFVDGAGVVFSQNYFDVPALQIVDQSGVQIGSDQLVASDRFLGFIGRLLAAANERGLNVSQVILPADTTRQVEVTFKGSPTKYKVSVDPIN